MSATSTSQRRLRGHERCVRLNAGPPERSLRPAPVSLPIACSIATVSLPYCLLDRADELGVLGRHQRAEAGDRSVLADEELLEVPPDVTVVAFVVGDHRQLLVDRVATRTVDLNLLVQRERDSVRHRAERLD